MLYFFTKFGGVCKATGTYTEYERTFGLGYDRYLAAKTGAVTGKQNDFKNAQVTLTSSGNGGIIKTGSGKVALEYQRYGRNKSMLVNKTYIDSGEYRRKFDRLSENKEVNKSLYECAKKALKHRSGTMLEDMFCIDGETGKILLSVEDSTEESVISYTPTIWNVIKNNSGLVALHTHPNSMPPSAADFNACYQNKYKFGIVACHNGKVYVYSSKQAISEKLYDLMIGDYVSKGFSEFNAQIKALERLRQNYDIDFMEM